MFHSEFSAIELGLGVGSPACDSLARYHVPDVALLLGSLWVTAEIEVNGAQHV